MYWLQVLSGSERYGELPYAEDKQDELSVQAYLKKDDNFRYFLSYLTVAFKYN